MLAIAGYGYYLTHLWDPLYPFLNASGDKDFRLWQYVGFAMIAFAVWNWHVIWKGLQSAGKFAVFVLLVAGIAATLGGQTDLLYSLFG
ncbi:hypothetical protein J6595_22220 [Jiella sp. KSK16Y-1]|uniref:Uncharacterized protein n=2 Tax=Jiella mangrovi TaxID=2821407 RepID=A0ABS4BP34_9HYPH|nr:hypothetical protein [Jiella mangrovi]